MYKNEIQDNSINPLPSYQMESANQYKDLQTLYGREKEKEELENAFRRGCTDQGELVFVHGFAGSGKTVLINKVFKYLVSEK